MNTKTLFATILGLTLATGVWAQATVSASSGTLNQPILDGDSSGFSSTLPVSAPGALPIERMRVFLNVSGSFNGDLYGYLSHGSTIAVLLNRVGRTVSNPWGYGDPGLDIVLDSAATANLDIHTYQVELTGGVPAIGSTWAADGRATDPASVLDTDARTAGLDVFNGGDVNGNWTLFLADVSGGGSHTLVSWGFEATVPEPSVIALMGLGLTVLLLRRRK